MSDGLTRGKAPSCLAKLLRLDMAVNPPVENLNHRRTGLQTLSANRADSICRYVCP